MRRMIAVKPAIVWHGSYAEDHGDVPQPLLLKAFASAILFGDGFLIDSRLMNAPGAPMCKVLITKNSGFHRMISRQYVRVLPVNPSLNERASEVQRMIDWPAPQATPRQEQLKNGFIQMKKGDLRPDQLFGGSNPPGLIARDDQHDADIINEQLDGAPSLDGNDAVEKTLGQLNTYIRSLMDTEVVALAETDVWNLLSSSDCDHRGCRNETEECRRKIMTSLSDGFAAAIGEYSELAPGGSAGSVAGRIEKFLQHIPKQAQLIVDLLMPVGTRTQEPKPIVIRTIDALGFIACW